VKETLPLFSHGAGGGSPSAISEVMQGVEAVLASSPGPWTAALIRKRWPAKPAPKPAVIETALEELEKRGAAHRLAGVRGMVLWSAAGLEWWLEEAGRRMIEMAGAAAAPVQEKKLLAAVWPKLLDPQPVCETLQRLEREGRLRRWAGKTPAWWRVGPEQAMAEALLAALGERAMERAKWVREAKARLRGPSAAQWQQAAAELIAAGRVMAHSTRVDGKRVEACVRAECRAALVEVYRPWIEKMRDEWRRLGIPDEAVARMFAPREPEAVETLLHELHQLERESPPPNPVAWLRRRAALQQISKEAFDAAALALLRQGKVYMALHDHPMRLPEEQRRELVSDGAGNFYVSISART
jgi:hypothetical protein